MTIFQKIKNFFIREVGDKTPYTVTVYEDGEEIKSFSSDEQDIETLDFILSMFDKTDKYQISYNIPYHRIFIDFKKKKSS